MHLIGIKFGSATELAAKIASRIPLKSKKTRKHRTPLGTASKAAVRAAASRHPRAADDGAHKALGLLAARLLRLQDDEHRRIARDLHDVTSQKIAFQSILLAQLGRGAEDTEERSLINKCQTLTNQISDEIRTLSYLLYPPLLDELGLVSAAQWYTERFRTHTGIDLHLKVAPDFPRLTSEVEMSLFRVLEESLTNVYRHAASPGALVRLGVQQGEIMLEVRDFGRGISQDGQQKSRTADSMETLGVGILGMRERMKQLSGRLTIHSAPGEGTQVVAALPSRVARSTAATEDRTRSPRCTSS